MPRKAKRPPETPEQLALGQYLRVLRKSVGRTTRDMSFSSGTICDVENGINPVSYTLLMEYAVFCYGARDKEDELNRLYGAAVMAHEKHKSRTVNIEQSAAKRRILTENYRRLMQEISAEIRGFSKHSQRLIEELDERTRKRFAEENDLYRVFLKDVGIPRDWRDVLAPDALVEVDGTGMQPHASNENDPFQG